MTQPATLFVCALCKFPSPAPGAGDTTGGQHLIDQLAECLAADQGEITIQPVRCMAACDRACNAALTAPGKLTLIFNGLSPQAAAPDLAEFCRQYAEATGGKVPYGLRSPAIKQATAYVLPPLVEAHSPTVRV
ncbi:MAG: metal-binding protein [Shackletoniella antarctica]|jgi:predicted metal-binding protein|uniref:Metal-binding protein n=1 Tax=Shackletoniella antarctica TaxID=268115 RepID=A0A2W4W6Z9_9CYAN|nr:MAG: metal-binding protein [Shackletoniella antarctica]